MSTIRQGLKSVLVTGGAGYIGSHIVRLLQAYDYQLTVVDNLTTGNAWSVPENALIVEDIFNTTALVDVMQQQKVQAVIHLAAKSSVPESFVKHDEYFDSNVNGTISVVEACAQSGVGQLIFSSTAAVYGNATHGLVKESAPLCPISPYGESKLAAEKVIAERCCHYGIKQVTLRFFNVIGAHPQGLLGQYNPSSSHLLQHCLDCVKKNTVLTIFGHDYDTSDGTAERDFIHVQDLASLHLYVLRYLEQGGESLLLNAGYGYAYSVLEFVRQFQHIAGHVITRMDGRRAGDPASLIADISKLTNILEEWVPEFNSLEQMIGSSWQWELSKRNLI
ncbi:MAG: UDP-glucose 4-epimerase GalE [Mariprofundus sp.]|nr:UDP-glucose 4-epimerase GalE [Mariprofundus sp.]